MGLHILGKRCAMRCLLIGPKILEARAAIGTEKSRVWIASEQGRGSLLFLIATHRFMGFHCAVGHRRPPKTVYPTRV